MIPLPLPLPLPVPALSVVAHGSGESGPVVVATDGCEACDAGVLWALDLADRLRLPLQVLHAGASPDLPAEQALRRVVASAGPARVRLAAGTTPGVAPGVLVAAAHDAHSLVLTRHHHPARPGLDPVGATLTAVAQYSPVPVVVVPPGGAGPARPCRVVVGIDRGSSSDAAVLWAGEHAERLGVPLAPVHVRPVEDGLLRQGRTVGAVDRDAETALAADVARLVPELTGALEPRVLVGAVGARLVSACCPLDLLVLGSRHPGGRTHWVLGGAGAHAVTHAPCPVVLTR